MKFIRLYSFSKIRLSVQVLIISLTMISCSNDNRNIEKLNDPELFHQAMQNLTDIIVYDIFSPPVASRIYVYPSIAAFETISFLNPEAYKSLSGQISGLEKIIYPTDKNINSNLASLYAFNKVGEKFIFSKERMKFLNKDFQKKIKNLNIPYKTIKASEKFGEYVANHILNWAKKDNYDITRTYPKYSIKEADHYWKPTPPDYMDGIEPHWGKIRTMVLDSANMFPSKPPLKFDLTKGSPFQLQLQQVFQIGDNLTDEQLNKASFWDCNPYVTHHTGHAMIATKKITPGGHWIGITAIASRINNSDFLETINAYANVSIALFDSFIACWDDKWKTLVVRPETLINKYYNDKWVPVLQTPPFPEYTSGHSVISRAAAVTLTDLYGENFSFVDTTELKYGLPERKYKSFIHASEEAAISRLYGGIHYMMAIEEGVIQGEKVGSHIVKKIQTKLN
ncbi:MAG: phosphatidic acid phosphatase [Flavobacteriales bacterium]|nr:phosphatidic acid phosphatase [Flavobacteriales bacterium]